MIKEYYEKYKDKFIILLACIMLAFIMLNFKQCNDARLSKQQAAKYEQNIKALNDTITSHKNKKGQTVFTDGAVEGNLDDVINSAAFKALSKEKQAFWLELQSSKRVIAAQQATISSQTTIISTLAYGAGATVTKDSVSFKKGSTVDIPKQTVGNFSYTAKVTFLDSIHMEVTPSYNLEITSTFKRQKDKSIIVEYVLDDPKAKVLTGQSFIIPQEDKTKWEKLVAKGLKVGRVVVPVACLAGGLYIGYSLAK